MAGVAHVLVSIVLGGVIIAVGLQFRSTVQSAQDTIIGCVLILTGLGFAAVELTGHGHHHGHDHAHEHQHPHADDPHEQMLLCLSNIAICEIWGCGVEEPVEVPGCVALEAALDLSGGVAFGLAAGCVGAGLGVVAHPAEHDRV